MVDFFGLFEAFFPEMRILIPETWKTLTVKKFGNLSGEVRMSCHSVDFSALMPGQDCQ